MVRLPLWDDLRSLRSCYTILIKPANEIVAMLCALDLFVGDHKDVASLAGVPLARRGNLAYMRLDDLNRLMHTPDRTLSQHKKSEPRVWPILLPRELFPDHKVFLDGGSTGAPFFSPASLVLCFL